MGRMESWKHDKIWSNFQSSSLPKVLSGVLLDLAKSVKFVIVRRVIFSFAQAVKSG
jgi:hypothetical protein